MINQKGMNRRRTRRAILRAGGGGMLGLTLPRLLEAQDRAASGATVGPAKAKSVVFLYQFGGPSHVDTFDMKTEAPDGIRSHFGQIATSGPGLPICEMLPQTAKVIDKVTLLRNVYHNMKNHKSAYYYSLTRHAPPLHD